MTDPPRRWLDSEIPAELQDVLRSAEGDRADAGQLASLEARLEQAIGPGFGGQAPGGQETQPPAAATGSTAAIGGGSALGGALAIAAVLMGLGAYWYGARAERPELPRAQSAVLEPAAVERAAVEPSAQVAPTASVAPPVLQPSAAEPSALAATPRPARQVAQGGGLVEELKQLEAIRRRLPAEPARALAAIAQHARRFPQGALGPERELLQIEALQRVGRNEEARRAAERALGVEAGHPYAVQIRQLIERDSEASPR